ncbi:hypothetical protein [Pseudooceanicola sp. C21-150M6]|uniref:hypothetical protein n=1 Tax=Pseudooceanicola sp. C21-150M6 TaxID=3434355 RepID=UPI003D7FBEF2
MPKLFRDNLYANLCKQFPAEMGGHNELDLEIFSQKLVSVIDEGVKKGWSEQRLQQELGRRHDTEFDPLLPEFLRGDVSPETERKWEAAFSASFSNTLASMSKR